MSHYWIGTGVRAIASHRAGRAAHQAAARLHHTATIAIAGGVL
jgi:hypothetical protein